MKKVFVEVCLRRRKRQNNGWKPEDGRFSGSFQINKNPSFSDSTFDFCGKKRSYFSKTYNLASCSKSLIFKSVEKKNSGFLGLQQPMTLSSSWIRLHQVDRHGSIHNLGFL